MKHHYDVFNGDADGLCALHQLRLSEPRAGAVPVTGVKRDIALLARVPAADCASATVLDVSMASNSDALLGLLDAGAAIHYVDHHHPGEIPSHPRLRAHIDTAADTCTGLLVDAELGGRHRAWAVVAAFGDNLLQRAREAAAPLALEPQRLAQLERLGTLLNYNGYGATLEDLHFDPVVLYAALGPHADPFDFIAAEPAYAVLERGYADDMRRAAALVPSVEEAGCALYRLPAARWARRVSGVFANQLVHATPQRAHAIVSERPNGGLQVSVRAPLAARHGADTLVRRFDSGGGRAAAAGINHLPEADLDRFIGALREQYGGGR